MSPTSYQAAPPRVSSCRITGTPRESSRMGGGTHPLPGAYQEVCRVGAAIISVAPERAHLHAEVQIPRLTALARDDIDFIPAVPQPPAPHMRPFFLLALILVPFASGTAQSAGSGKVASAELPRVTVNTAYPSGGRAVRVSARANLQDALDAARPGDVLLLAPGATYVGNFHLPNTSAGSNARAGGWIVLRTDLPGAPLGAAGDHDT